MALAVVGVVAVECLPIDRSELLLFCLPVLLQRAVVEGLGYSYIVMVRAEGERNLVVAMMGTDGLSRYSMHVVLERCANRFLCHHLSHLAEVIGAGCCILT